MNKLIIYILVFLTSNFLFSQKIDLDSLLAKAKTDSQLAYAYQEIANSHLSIDVNKSIENYIKALEYVNKTNNEKFIGRIKIQLGSAYINSNKLILAEKQLNSAYYNFFNISDDDGIAQVYTGLGRIKYLKGDLVSAHKYWEESLKLYKILNYRIKLAGAYSNIAIIYSELGDDKKALKNFKLAAKILEKEKQKTLLTNMYGNIGIVYQRMKDYKNAEMYFNKSIYLKKLLGDEIGIAIVYGNLAIIYSDKKEFKKALEYNLKSLEIKQRHNYLKGISITFLNICNNYISLKKFDNALNYALDGLRISEENNVLNDEAKFNDLLFTIYKNKGEQERANYYKNIYNNLKDSIEEIRNKEKALEINSDDKAISVEDSLSKNDSKNETKEVNSINHFTIITSIIAVFFILGIILVILINRKKIK